MVLNDHSDDMVIFLQLQLGGDRNFCYLMGEAASGIVAAVDPGFEPGKLAQLATKRGLRIAEILVTHGHPDHCAGSAELADLTGATVRAGRGEKVAGALALDAGAEIPLGGLKVQALSMPGHTADHFCFLLCGRLVSGDLLFCGKVGGTGPFFEGSSAAREWDSLQALMQLPGETLVFPGHDYYGGDGTMPHSSIAHERRHNPFITCSDFEAFCDLKENWAAYKEEHGIR